MRNKLLSIFMLLTSCITINAQQLPMERKQIFDQHWKFKLGDMQDAQSFKYNDAGWTELNLPHDWSIEGQPDAKNATGNAGGYYPSGIGWYRKSFTLNKDYRGKKVWIYFEGVYMNSSVYINGHLVGGHPYGYVPFYCDVTPYLHLNGKNIIAVRVDNSKQINCRWYSGSGIYRHVWLVTANPVHIDHWGAEITTQDIKATEATVKVKTTVVNENDNDADVTLQIGIGNKSTSAFAVTIPANSKQIVTRNIKVDKPLLWSLQTPHLYKANIEIKNKDKVIDKVSQTFGICQIKYSAKDGLSLNNQKILLNGGCVHHDNGILGAASYDKAEIRKAELMKEAGFNAVRTSHNPPSEAFLNACDSIGLLVIDEAFDGWREAKTPYDYSTLFDQYWHEDIKTMLLRDRNHPAIFCWSIGNEVMERKKIEIVTTAHKLASAVHEYDGAQRPVTSALAAWDNDWEIYDPLAAQLDIVGYNYMIEKSESDHERIPSRMMMQTESYPRDAFSNWAKVNDHKYILGDFVWTAIDYLGESGIGRYYYKGDVPGEHYERDIYPWHGAYCGDIDITGWRKPISHYRNMLYNNDEHLYMAVKEPDGYNGKISETKWSVWPTWESWNWHGFEGKNISVEIYSKYPLVRLYLNDKLIGERPVNRSTEYKAVFDVAYQAGTLKAEGIEDGTVKDVKLLTTAGKPYKIKLTPNTTRLKADGEDLSFVTLEILDENNHLNPDAGNEIQLTIHGEGVIAAAGSADLKDRDSYTGTKHKAWKGRMLVVVKSTHKSGKIALTASAPGLVSSTITISTKGK